MPFVGRYSTSKAANQSTVFAAAVVVLHGLHPVSITRFSVTRFLPGSGLLRNPFFIGSGVIFSRVSFPATQNLKITSQGLDS